MRGLAIGDRVVYRMQKTSPCPDPRARHVYPGPNGEEYTCVVDEYWTVISTPDNQTVTVRTPAGRAFCVRRDDPRLRKANVFERLFHGSRFHEMPDDEPIGEQFNEQFDFAFDG